MSTYVMSDIHEMYDLFLNILEQIDLKYNDTLYVMGDVLDDEVFENIMLWMENDGETTLQEFRDLSKDAKSEIIEYIKDCDVFKRLSVGGKKFILVHAGLGKFNPNRYMSSKYFTS